MAEKQKTLKKYASRRDGEPDLDKKPAMFWVFILTIFVVVLVVGGIFVRANQSEADDEREPDSSQAYEESVPEEEDEGVYDDVGNEMQDVSPEAPDNIRTITQTVTQNTSGYLIIEQWGVGFRIPQGFTNIAFWLESHGSLNNTLFFADGAGSACPIGGSITRSTTAGGDFRVGDMYYTVERVASSCGAGSRWAEPIWQMLQNPARVTQ